MPTNLTLSSSAPARGATGPLDEGTMVTWDFRDFPGAFPVHVRKVERNKLKVYVEHGVNLREFFF